MCGLFSTFHPEDPCVLFFGEVLNYNCRDFREVLDGRRCRKFQVSTSGAAWQWSWALPWHSEGYASTSEAALGSIISSFPPPTWSQGGGGTLASDQGPLTGMRVKRRHDLLTYPQVYSSGWGHWAS